LLRILKSNNGAVAYITLFVTHYNFLRPHMALGYQVPIPQPDLKRFDTIQEKWCRIIDVGKHILPSLGPMPLLNCEEMVISLRKSNSTCHLTTSRFLVIL
jgi:hypothetical protein